EADESKIGKSKSQIWRNQGLQGSADSPKVGDLEPAATSGPKRHDDYHHGPIAQLHWQHFLPCGNAELPRYNQIGDVVYQEQRRNRETDRALEKARFGSVNDER